MSRARLGAGAFALLGLGISVYLTVVHYAQGQVALLCATSGTINCEQVTTSPESNVGPIPVALLGVVWFLVSLVLVAIPRTQVDAAGSVVWNSLRLAWSGAGVLVVFYLIYSELFLIGAICLWCTAIHGLVILLFLLTLNEWADGSAKVGAADAETREVTRSL